ncbi:MAG: hypothetical protein ACI9IP_000026 [Arcticibacterium sp.]|jgi:hypothetical protein
MYSSFENQWREALRDAEENPPIDVWRNIETKLDQEFLAEAIIKNKLVTASEIPDSFVWDNIASALEEDRKPVFFVWFNKYSATGIAALLLLALSFSIFKSPFGGTAENKVSKASPNFEIPDSKISENKSEKYVSKSTDRGPESEKVFNKTANTASSIKNQAHIFNSLSNVSKNSKATTASYDNIVRTEKSVGSESSESSLVSSLAKTFTAMKSLVGKGFDPYGNSFVLKRNKLSYNTPDEYLGDNRNFIQRSWFGLISGISPFDPNFKISNFERAALVSASDVPVTSFEPNSVSTNPIQRETFAIPLSQPYNDVKAGNSINLGFNYGKRIKNRFSIGTGIRYMAGRSLVASNVYSYNERTGSVSTFLESYYIRGESSFTNNTVISSGGDIDNEYKFLMIPLNVGYHLPITQKLEASFITGVSGDFIINNVFDNLPEAGSKLTASNSAYKPLNLSGIAGVKMNYMVRDNWEISVGSNVQQTLTSGVDRAEGFTFKPRYLGINYGVNYRFN